ncbi:hypothetical protein QYE76_044149 [Lolium multiflorum]|uniref:AIG1-type G domain-containing protein n=1 Tax=Lolium multiflorum TaxID=4521 RepID=A0AAD8TIQ3_LOLMU|nr:hypothetical protein QYE76_044149 [Lolium multiflorum]
MVDRAGFVEALVQRRGSRAIPLIDFIMGGGGNDGDGDWAVLPCPPLAEVTLALVGKIGTGKSATANCIIGKEAFASERSYVSVTETCQKSSTTFQDGCVTRTVNVIDTPDARKEIVKCIEMSKHGIHAMLMEVPDRHDEVSVDGYSAEMINDRLTQTTKTDFDGKYSTCN